MIENATQPGAPAPLPFPPISSLLVTQAKPAGDHSPYAQLTEKHGVRVDFREFIQIDPVSYKDFRKYKIGFTDFTAIIFTSRNAVDHFFRICQEAKVEMPADMKYFCISEQTAYYLQKYITLRKRKLFVGEKTATDLFDVIKKHKAEKFLFPCSNIRKGDIPDFLAASNISFTEAIVYRTVASDLSDLAEVKYDCLAFFSPSAITSLFINFPDFQQNETRIAAFGPTTAQAVIEAGLRLDIEAPRPNAPSMTGAIERYIIDHQPAAISRADD